MFLEKFIKGWQDRTTCRLAAVGATIGVVASMTVGAAFDRAYDPNEELAQAQHVTVEDLNAALIEGSATTSEENAIKVLMAQGFTKKEARVLADELMEMPEDADTVPKAKEKKAGDAAGGGAAGLSKSASLPTSQSLQSLTLPKALPDIPNQPSGDGNHINSVTAKWITESPDDVSGISGCDSADLLCLAPQNDVLQDVTLQLNYSLSGEHDYEPGTVRITVPAQIVEDRDGNLGGTTIIPYPEAPKRTQDFNWERVGDNYVLTNTRTLSAATQGFIQFGLVDNSKVHSIKSLQSFEWQAAVEVITNKGNTLGKLSNPLQLKVKTFQQLDGVSKNTITYDDSGTVVDASQIPAAQRINGVNEYVIKDWAVTVTHHGNQPFKVDITDTIPSEYGGFIIGATSSDGRTLEKKVFEGYSYSDKEQFTVRTAYPKSSFPDEGVEYTLRNNVSVALTPLDDNVSSSKSANNTAIYKHATPPVDEETTFTIGGGYSMCKAGNNGVQDASPSCSGSGNYMTGLNDLKKGEDIEVGYTTRSEGRFLLEMYNGPADDDIAKRIFANYTENPRVIEMVTTDSGAQVLGESGLTAGTDYEFMSLRVDKPKIGKAESYGLNPDGSFINPYNDHAGIRTVDDNDASHIPDIAIETKVGATWKPYATVKYSTGTCQIAYAGTAPAGASATNCSSIPLPSGTTQFRTKVTTEGQPTVASMEYFVYPTLKIYGSNTNVQSMAEHTFDNNHYTPSRTVRNTANMVVTAGDDNHQVRTVNSSGDDVLRGFTADTQVFAEKSAVTTRQDANYDRHYVTIHYTAKAREETFIPSQDIYNDLVRLGEFEQLKSGVWYDLLPLGVYPVLETVQLRNGDTVKSVRTVEDWNGSGRIMLIVEADLTPQLETYRIQGDSQQYLRDVTTITFDGRFNFDSIADYDDVLHNVIAFEAGKDQFGTVPTHKGEANNPSGNNNVQTASAFKDGAEREAMQNLHPVGQSARTTPSFVYAGAWHSLSALFAATSSLNKSVMVNNDGIWKTGTYGDDADVYEGGVYAYRLRMESNQSQRAKDLIFFDALENYTPVQGNAPEDVAGAAAGKTWQGDFLDVDLSQMRSKGVDPVVWYSTTVNGFENQDNMELVEGANWSKTKPAGHITAIAIDARQKIGGGEFVLEPLESISAIVHMRAPSDAEAAQAVANDAHAYNNVFLKMTSLSEGGGTSVIHKDYTKVGLTEFHYDVEKVWDDDDDRDGIRPSSVRVKLLADGQPVEGVDPITLSAANDWKGTFAGLDYAHQDGTPIQYSVAEDPVPTGYTLRPGTGVSIIKARNVHEPERINLSGTKTWGNTAGQPIPSSVKIVLYADGEAVQSKTVRPDSQGNWNYEFTNLYKYHDHGTPIVYTLGEEGVSEAWRPTPDANNPMNITNDWHPYGDVVLSKHVEGATSVASQKEFSFRLSLLDSNGNPLPDAYEYEKSDGSTGTVQHNDTVTLRDGQSLRIKELPMGGKARAEEGDMPGFTVQGEPFQEVDIHGNRDNALAFTNVYKTSGAVNLEAKKTLTGQELRRGQFLFEVYDEGGNLVRSSGNAADSTVTFGAFRYSNADAGKTYTYTVKEKNAGLDYITYSEAVYKATVSVTDNGNGTMSTNVVYEPVSGGAQLADGKPHFTNAYHASGEAPLKAWKTLNGRDAAAGEFSFELYDANGTKLQTKTNAADGVVNFDPLRFNETHIGQTFLYVIREQAGSNTRVEYDNSVFGYQIEVVDNRNGTLGFKLTRVKVKAQGSGWVADGETEDDAVFKNKLLGSLSVEKHTTSSNDLFRFKVKLTGEDIPTNAYSYTLSEVDNTPQATGASATLPSSRGASNASNEATSDDLKVTLASASLRGDNSLSPLSRGGASSADAATSDQSFFSRLGALIAAKLPSKSVNIKAATVSGNLPGGGTYSLDTVSGVLTLSGTIDGGSNTTSYDFRQNPLLSEANRALVKEVTTDGTVTLKGDVAYIFMDYSNLEKISGTWNTTNVTGMSYMFMNSPKLSDISALSGWDTSNVTNMTYMFINCSSLTDISGLANWDTSKVTNMAQMFSHCSFTNVDALKTKQVTVNGRTYTAWDTSSVTNMRGMFEFCSKLQNVDGLVNWNTSRVYNMLEVFRDCTNLTDATGLRNWNTSGVRDYGYGMSSLFYNSPSLKTVNIASWDMTRIADNYWPYINGNKFSSLTVGPNTRLRNVSSPYQWYHEDNGALLMSAADMVAVINAGEGAGTWKAILPVYTVTRVHGGADGLEATGGPFTDEVEFEEDYTIPGGKDFHLLGYSFIGWSTQKNGSNINLQECRHTVNGQTNYICQPGDVIPANSIATNDPLTLTAQWTPRSTSVDVQNGEFEFELYGGEKATFNNLPVGTSYEVYEYTKKGWVLVRSSNTSGTIPDPANGSAAASFTNSPINGVATAQVEANKLLDGVGAEANKFSFNLLDISGGGYSQTGVKNSAGGAIQFRQIVIYDPTVIERSDIPDSVTNGAFAVYRADQLPTLAITETGTYAGITTDSRPVLVTLNNPFNLTQGQEVVEYSRTPVFENTTQPGELHVHKTIENAPANFNGSFTMHVALTNENGVPLTAAELAGVTAKITGGTTDTPVNVSWANGAADIAVPGSRTLVLTDLPAGTKYSVEEVDIPRGWSLTRTAGDTGTISAGGETLATMTNTYGASGTVDLEAWKSLVERELQEGEFTFELYEGTNPASGATPIATTTNLSPDIRPLIPADETGEADWIPNPHQGQAAVIFEDIQITSEGTHTYTIREVKGGDNSVTYDKRDVTVTVTATDVGNGTYDTTVSYSGGKDGESLFENVYSPVPPSSVKITKAIDNEASVPADVKDSLFLMEVKLSGDTQWAGKMYPISYSVSGVTSAYRPNEWNTGESDTIVIGVRAGETVGIDGLEAGTHYSVSETGWMLNGSEGERPLGYIFSHVSTRYAGGGTEGIVGQSAGNSDAVDVTVTNHYNGQPPSPKNATISIEAHKTAKNFNLQGDDFNFELLDSNGERIATASNNATGDVLFENVVNFTESDAGRSFIYRIREVVPAGDDASQMWQYDEHEEVVRVRVTVDGDELVATLDYSIDNTVGAEFTNTYTPPVGEIVLQADKEIEATGIDPNNINDFDGAFNFELLDSINGVNNVVATASNEGDGTIRFPAIEYGVDDIGEHTYIIREVVPDPAGAGWTYDRHYETVTVTVADNGGAVLAVDATYDVGVEYSDATHNDNVSGARFVNRYNFDPPAAGFHLSDITQAALLLLLLAALVATGYTVSHLRRRSR